MPGNKNDQSKSTWPLVKYYFVISIGKQQAVFQEVSGLSSEEQIIEYRGQNSPVFSTVKMPGIVKFGNITAKKGLFKDDKFYWELHSSTNNQNPKRYSITISLLDEADKVAMSWVLSNAFIARITSTNVNNDANEIAVESMEITHEGFKLI